MPGEILQGEAVVTNSLLVDSPGYENAFFMKCPHSGVSAHRSKTPIEGHQSGDKTKLKAMVKKMKTSRGSRRDPYQLSQMKKLHPTDSLLDDLHRRTPVVSPTRLIEYGCLR